MEKGKRRSRGQRIGKEGEKTFELWATRNGLTTNQANEDVGIDFFCQVLKAVGKKGSEESVGRVLGVQVKRVEASSSPAVILSKRDVVDLLRQAQATCLIGIHLQQQEIRFRFIDRSEIDRFLEFLFKDVKTLSLPFSQMETDVAIFKRELIRQTNPPVQHQLRIYQIQKRMASIIPGSEVGIRQSATDALSVVSIPWINSAFDVKSEALDDVRTRIFHYGDAVFPLPGVTLKPEVVAALGASGGQGILLGAREKLTKLTIESGSEHASASVILRRLNDEFAYVLKPGLRLSFSGVRKVQGRWVHVFEWDLFAPRIPIPLKGSALSFIRLLRPDAYILLSSKNKVPVKQWMRLDSLGHTITVVQMLCQALKIDFSDFRLIDLRNEEFAVTLSFLDYFLLQSFSLERFVPGFIVGPSAKLPIQQVPTQEALLKVPIVLNWKSIGILIWLTCEATAFLDNGLCCGFRVERQIDWRLQKLPRFEKSIYPELWVRRVWPAIEIGNWSLEVQTWKKNAKRHITLEASIGPR